MFGVIISFAKFVLQPPHLTGNHYDGKTSVTSHINCMLPDKRCLSHGMCLYQVMMTLHFLNNVTYDADSSQTSKIRS